MNSPNVGEYSPSVAPEHEGRFFIDILHRGFPLIVHLPDRQIPVMQSAAVFVSSEVNSAFWAFFWTWRCVCLIVVAIRYFLLSV
jgi:hypothetical protein